MVKPAKLKGLRVTKSGARKPRLRKDSTESKTASIRPKVSDDAQGFNRPAGVPATDPIPSHQETVTTPERKSEPQASVGNIGRPVYNPPAYAFTQADEAVRRDPELRPRANPAATTPATPASSAIREESSGWLLWLAFGALAIIGAGAYYFARF
ncbi:MAG: hypothetical protein AB7L09_21350 [Nitrospira sp.]